MSSFCSQETKYKFTARTCTAAGLAGNDIAGLFQGMGSSHLSFRCNHFGPRLPRSFRLRGHGSLELHRKSDVLSESRGIRWISVCDTIGDRKYMNKYASAIVSDLKMITGIILSR